MTTTTEFGDPRLPGTFWARVKRSTSGCWHWTGTIEPTGYGRFWVTSKDPVLPHRHAYHVLVEALIPRGQEGHLQVDHECHNRSKSCKGGSTCLHRRCVNPAHLAAKTPGDNSGASRHTVTAKGRAMTQCPQGHPLSGDNLGRQPGGRRYCKQCQVERTSENRRERVARERGPYWEKVEWNSKKTHCPQGHPYSGSNLIVRLGGARACRACQDEAQARYRERHRAGVVPAGLRADWTHCPKNHPLDGTNLVVDAKSGKRRCRRCKAEASAASYERRKAARRAG